MTEWEKMLAGEVYDCGDPQLMARWHKAKDLTRDYNRTDSEDGAEKDRILGELLGGRGARLWIPRRSMLITAATSSSATTAR